MRVARLLSCTLFDIVNQFEMPAMTHAAARVLTVLNPDVARWRVMSRSMSRAGPAANFLAERDFPEPSVMSRDGARIRGYKSPMARALR